MRLNTASGFLSEMVISVPPFDKVYNSVFKPPIWSKRRNERTFNRWRLTSNFFVSHTMSCNAAFETPVEPDENSTSPGCPVALNCW